MRVTKVESATVCPGAGRQAEPSCGEPPLSRSLTLQNRYEQLCFFNAIRNCGHCPRRARQCVHPLRGKIPLSNGKAISFGPQVYFGIPNSRCVPQGLAKEGRRRRSRPSRTKGDPTTVIGRRWLGHTSRGLVQSGAHGLNSPTANFACLDVEGGWNFRVLPWCC